MSKLTYKQRKKLPSKSFVFPSKKPGGGSYPIPDIAHGRNALARVAQHGTSEEKARVRAKVKRKFPSIKSKPTGSGPFTQKEIEQGYKVLEVIGEK
jgi:hypothetical protein